MPKILAAIRPHTALAVLLAGSLYIRLALLSWWRAFPFGDVFNYVGIAKALAHFSYPVLDKRLPFYPLLILIIHTITPWWSWESVAIGIAIASSLVAIALLYFIGLKLGAKKPAIILALTLYAAFQPFLSYSIRGYADTTFILLMAGAILLTLSLKNRTRCIWLAITLGCLCLTRYEGVVASIVILFFALLKLTWRRWRDFALMILVMLAVASPYFIIAQRVGRSLLPQAYLQQAASVDQGYGAKDFGDFKDRYWGIWDRLGLFDLYERPKILIGELKDNPWGFHQDIADLLINPKTVAGLIATVGLLVLLSRRRFTELGLVALPYLAIATAIAWWAAFIRYDAMLFPLIVILAMIGFDALINSLQKVLGIASTQARAVSIVGWIFVLIFGGGIWLWSATQDTQGTLVKSQYRQLAYYQAIQKAQTIPGPILFEKDDSILDTYFADRALFADSLSFKNLSSEQKWATIEAKQITTIFTSSRTAKNMAFLQTPPSQVQISSVASYKVEQGNGDTDQAEIIHLTWQP